MINHFSVDVNLEWMVKVVSQPSRKTFPLSCYLFLKQKLIFEESLRFLSGVFCEKKSDYSYHDFEAEKTLTFRRHLDKKLMRIFTFNT